MTALSIIYGPCVFILRTPYGMEITVVTEDIASINRVVKLETM